MNSSKGFSLIELIIVVAIIGIIAMIGVPSYGNMMERNRVVSASNNLLGAMQLARSEAATRHTEVRVCASSDQSTCSGSDWSAGGLVMITASNELIRLIPATNDVAINGAAINFRSDGTSAGGFVTVGDRSVIVNAIGRARIQ